MTEMETPNEEQLAKLERLKTNLKELGSVAVAFSSGVDSTFLLKTAHDLLGERAVAVTARSGFFPKRELQEAQDFCAREGITQITVELDALQIEGVAQNPPDRCYRCKRALLKKIIEAARERGIAFVAEGSNLDDEGDYRPGMRAVAELGILSPLRAAGLSKKDIRALSKKMGLPTWDKPSFACLASRFVYGETITEEALSRVEQAEQLFLDRGFRQVRVRVHGNLARVEIPEEEFEKLAEGETRAELADRLKKLGFSYAALDLEGYRTGSMNETLEKQTPYSRTERLLGSRATEILQKSRVAVFGIGGVGGYAVEALARSGVGAFDLIDSDRVCLSNLNRQIIATHRTIGQYKVDAMKERILEINPNAQVEVHRCFFLPKTQDAFDFSKYSYVIDAVDTVAAKIELVLQAQRAGVPVISSMGAGNKLDPCAFEVADLYETSVCPLAKVMRRELKKRGVERLKVVYSKEEPVCPAQQEAGQDARGAAPGSVAFVPSVAGLVIAGEVIKDLTGNNRKV